MALSNPILMRGIHIATIEDRSDYSRYPIKVVGGGELSISQDPDILNGGSQIYPWGVGHGFVDGSLELTVRQYDVAVLKYFNPYLAASLTEDTDGEAAGSVAAPTNLVGTSVVNATTGVASVAVKGAENPKIGNYIIKAASATTFDLYLDSDIDGVSIDDNMKLTSTPLTLPGTGGTVDVDDVSLTFTGGSGAISMTTGDMARLVVKPQSNYLYEFKGGQTGQSLQEFGMYIYTEKLGSNQYRALHLPKVVASGAPIAMNEKEWSTFTTTLTVQYDSALDYAWKMTVVGR